MTETERVPLVERSLQPFYPELSRIGTETRLGTGAMLWHEGDPGDSVVLLLDGRECEWLDSLPKADQNRIRSLARREDKLRAQSSAAKSTKEVPASPTPPPAIAPATP